MESGSWFVKLYAPSNSTNCFRGPVRSCKLNAVRNYPTTANLVIDFDWEKFKDEQDPNNEAQQNSYLEIWDGENCEFRGLVKYVLRERIGGKPVVFLTARCKLDALNSLPASYDDGTTVHRVWMRQTPVLELTNIDLFPISATPPSTLPPELKYLYYPDTTSDAWLPNSVGPDTTLGETVTAISPASGGRLKLSQSNPKAPPVGFLTIASGTEFIFYNGLELDPADDYYYANNIVRGAIGTTAGAGVIGDTVHFRSTKRIDLETPRYIEGDTGSGWDLLNGPYTTQDEDGGFLFADDPLKYRGGSSDYTALRAQVFGVFDEDNASRLTLDGLVSDMLSVAAGDLGPEWGGGGVDPCGIRFNISPEIVLTRVVVDRPSYILEVLRGIASDLQLINGVDSDALFFGYDPREDEFYLEGVSQATTPQLVYGSFKRVIEDNSIDDVYSAIVGSYGSLIEQNLIDETRIWHEPADNDPNFPRCYQLLNGNWYYRGASTDLLIPQPFRMTRNTGEDGTDEYPKNTLTDRLNNTGWALAWDTEPAAGVVLYAWFNEESSYSPKLFFINKARAVFEAMGYTAAGSRFGAKLVAYETFTGSGTSSPPTLGTARNISPKLSFQFTPGEVNFPDFSIEDEGLFVPARAIGLYVTGFLQDANKNDWYTIKLKELFVSAVPMQIVESVLRDTYSSGDTNGVVGPETYSKIVNAHTGQHKVGIFDYGDTTYNAASYLSFLQLVASHGMAQTRRYEVNSRIATGLGAPKIGQTVGFSGESYSGVCDEFELSYEHTTGKTYTMRLINFNSPVFGS